MARVVQQRTNMTHLYLLIVMTFLFLIATVLAVWLYLDGDKAKIARDEAENYLGEFVSTRQREKGEVAKMLKDVRKNKRSKKTVLGLLMAQRGAFIQAIVGEEKETTYELAKQKTDDARAMITEVLGETEGIALADGVQLAVEKIQQLQKDVQALQQTEISLESSIKALQAKLQEDLAGANVELADRLAELDAMQAQLGDAQNQYEEQLDDAHSQSLAQVQSLEKTISLLSDDIERKMNEISSKKESIDQMTRRFDALKPPIPEVPPADGKILKVQAQEDICYINIGFKDNLLAGTSFSVYSATIGIPNDGEGKATIEVTTVNREVSVCRIIKQDKSDPILEGDLISSAAYDPRRTYTFFVIGEFDMLDPGRMGVNGSDQIKALIKRSGGKIVNKLDLTTDYLVAGRIPPEPPAVADDAEPQVLAAMRDLEQNRLEYEEIKQVAMDIKIPVLNTHRFLAFIGYTPQRVMAE